jgi:hypothetical protein
MKPISKTRRAVSLICALTLTVIGLLGAIWFLFFANVYSFRLAGGAGLVLAVGVMWLYSDFIDATPNEENQ